MADPTIFLSAGDPSGDNASAHLVASLARRWSGLTVIGLGGPRLKSLGQEQLVDGSRLAVLGFWEVARRFRFFRGLLAHCQSEIAKRQPGCVILVDYPGFNLRLAERIKPFNIPIIYYISPQIWAWGSGRLEQIRRLVDLMVLILPFEEAFYRKSGVKARFVGHYLLEDIPSEYTATPPPREGHLALLPGSRPQEVERMLPVMLDAAEVFCHKYSTQAVIAGVHGAVEPALYERLMKRVQAGPISIRYGDARKVIHDSSLVLTSSGTATLESAIIGRPMVVVYKTGVLTYLIARRLVKLDKIALANLVLNEKVVPELIQGQANTGRILAELDRFKDDAAYYQEVAAKLQRVPGLLGGRGASERAAELVGEYL
ncbi:MAG: lipid-A-disaccharide synthase [candidate division Zixibacteria bacterium]|nr:lipid-A-disaccharide synthase [candidate division Zixibacteria bacterium]